MILLPSPDAKKDTRGCYQIQIHIRMVWHTRVFCSSQVVIVIGTHLNYWHLINSKGRLCGEQLLEIVQVDIEK